jgi:hypothetical protein
MDAASGGHPACGDGAGIAYGVIFAPLTVVHPDRIMVDGQTFYLRDGQTCPYQLGRPLEVVYVEIDERRYVERITEVRLAM